MLVFQIFTVSFPARARAVIPDMRAAGWGRIVHIGSAIAKEPQRDLAHVLHNTIRSSTTSLVKSLADEFARDGVTINTTSEERRGGNECDRQSSSRCSSDH